MKKILSVVIPFIFLTGCTLPQNYKVYSESQADISASNQALAEKLLRPFENILTPLSQTRMVTVPKKDSPAGGNVTQKHVGLASVNYDNGALDVAEIPVLVVNNGGQSAQSEMSFLKDYLLEQERTKQVNAAAKAVMYITDRLAVQVEAPYSPKGNIDTAIRTFGNPLLLLGWGLKEVAKTGIEHAGDRNNGTASTGGTIGPGSGTNQPETTTLTIGEAE